MNGNGSSFRSLYEQHYDFLWRSALRLGVPRSGVEDLLQDTFLVAYQRLPEFEGRAKVSTWLFSILHNLHRNQARKRLREQQKQSHYSRDVAIPVCGKSLDFGAEQHLAQSLLEGFLDDLDHKKRAVFVLAELEGLSGREIADALDVNVNTVHTRLRAARSCFQGRFGEETRGLVRQRITLERAQPPQAPLASREKTAGALMLAGVDLWPPGVFAKLTHAIASLGSKLSLSVAGVGATLALGLTALVPGTRARPSERQEQARILTADGAPPRTVGPRTATTVIGADEVEEQPIVVTPAPATSGRPSSPAASLSHQVQTWTQARAALRSRDAEGALTLLQTIPTTGPLAWERATTEFAARCRLGDLEQARTIARRWNDTHDDREMPSDCR